VHPALALAGAGFVICGVCVVVSCARFRTRSYRDFLAAVWGRSALPVVDLCLTLFALGELAIVLAGSAALFEERFSLPPEVGLLLTACAIYFVVRRRLYGVLAADVLLVPALAAILLGVSALTPHPAPPVEEDGAVAAWAARAVLYVAYNSVIAIVGLAPLGEEPAPRRALASGAIIGGVVLGLMVCAVARAAFATDAAGYEVPMGRAAERLGPAWQAAYGVALWASLLTTGLAFALGLQADDRRRDGGGGTRRLGLWLLAAVPLSRLGFSRLIGSIYPAVGILGLVTLVLTMFASQPVERA